jgi:hypothetical protein
MAKFNRRNRSSRKVMRMNKSRVCETMSRAAINESLKSEPFRSRKNKWRSKRKLKGIGIGESGRVESKTLCSTGGVNAVPSLCRVLGTATYFPELFSELFSVISAFLAVALAAEAAFFLHSFTLWPALPQKRQRLLSRRRFRSSLVSLPSLPSLSERSGLAGLEGLAGVKEEDEEVVAGLEGLLPLLLLGGLLAGLLEELGV